MIKVDWVCGRGVANDGVEIGDGVGEEINDGVVVVVVGPCREPPDPWALVRVDGGGLLDTMDHGMQKSVRMLVVKIGVGWWR